MSCSLSSHCPLISQSDPSFNFDNHFQNSKMIVKILNSANVVTLQEQKQTLCQFPFFFFSVYFKKKSSHSYRFGFTYLHLGRCNSYSLTVGYSLILFQYYLWCIDIPVLFCFWIIKTNVNSIPCEVFYCIVTEGLGLQLGVQVWCVV